MAGQREYTGQPYVLLQVQGWLTVSVDLVCGSGERTGLGAILNPIPDLMLLTHVPASTVPAVFCLSSTARWTL